MTLKEREQTVKDLQEIVDNYSGSWQRFNVLNNALAIIKELAEENERLRDELEIKSQKRVNIFELVESYDRGKTKGVKKMRSEIERRCIEGGIYPAFVAKVVEDVEREMLEGKSDV